MTLEKTLEKLTAVTESPLYIVTATSGAEKGGCVVSFATQASIDPVRFLVSMSHSTHTYGLVEESRACAMHWIDRDQEDLVRHFAEKTGFEQDKFEGIGCREGPLGSPIIGACPGHLELELRHELLCGDHTAYLGDPVEGEYRHSFRCFTLYDAWRAGIKLAR